MIVDLPIGNFRHRFWEKDSKSIQPSITVDDDRGPVELYTRHEELGDSSIAMVGSARLTTPDGKQRFMDLESRSVRNASGNIVNPKIPNGMQQVLFQTDLQPGAKLGVQVKCDAVHDAHMRKLVVAMTKCPEELRSMDDMNSLPVFHPNATITVIPDKPSELEARGSPQWAARKPLKLDNCVGVMLQALTHTEPDLYRLSKRNVDKDVHPLLVDAIRQLGIAPPVNEGATIGGDVCRAEDCSAEPREAKNRYGAGESAMARNDWWEGGDVKKIHWLVPPEKFSQYKYPLPFWIPSPESVALALFRRAHQPIPDNLRGAAKKYTAKLMNTSATQLLNGENSSLEEAVNEMLITPFAPNVARQNLLPTNYRLRMHNLLVMELAQAMWDLRRFDLVAAKVKRSTSYEMDGNVIYSNGPEVVLQLPVYSDQQAHIGDTRPSVLVRDVVRIRPFLYEDISDGGKYKEAASKKPTIPGPEVFEAEVVSVTPQSITARVPCSENASKVFTKEGTICSVRYMPQLLPDRFMHRAIEAMHVSRLFPAPSMILPDAWNRERCVRRSDLYDNKLDETQFAIVNNILTSSLLRVPTVVVGPYGCGKTRTLQEVVRQLTTPECSYRVLVATHTNTSADMYVKALSRHLHSNEMIRIYAERRKESSVAPLVRKYTYAVNSTDDNGNPIRVFGVPPVEELMKFKVIITTLVTAGSLMSSGVAMRQETRRLQSADEVDPTLTAGASTDFFSHVLVDEAAQAAEPEALVALSLAGPQSKIVLVGDHMQLGPDIRHPTARRLGLHRSVLERLYALPVYDGNRAGQCKLALCHNYRSHPAIVKFTSRLFYGTGLVPKVTPSVPAWPQMNHNRPDERRWPLAFVCTGETAAEREPISCSWENKEECKKIATVVTQLLTSPDLGGGGVSYSEVAVVTPYSQQVRLLRNHFRQEAGRLKREYQKIWERSRAQGGGGSQPPLLEKVRITHVRDVQGLEFGVLVMSTVRTLHDILFGEDEAEGVGGDVEAGGGGLIGGKGDAWSPINVQGVDEVLGAPDDSDDEEDGKHKAKNRPRFTDTRYNAHKDDVADSESDEEDQKNSDLKENFADDTAPDGFLSRRKRPPSIGLFRNTRLFNTSITRAKSMIIGVGDPALLYYDRCWRALIRSAHQNGTMEDKPHASETLRRLDDMVTVAKHRYGKIQAPQEVLDRLESVKSDKTSHLNDNPRIEQQNSLPSSPLVTETQQGEVAASAGESTKTYTTPESKLKAQSTPYNPFYRVQPPQLTYAQMQLQMQMQYQMQLQMRINMQVDSLQRLQMLRQQGVSDPSQQQIIDNNIKQYQQSLWMLKQQQQQHMSMVQQFQQQVHQQMQQFKDTEGNNPAANSFGGAMPGSFNQMGNVDGMMGAFSGMSDGVGSQGVGNQMPQMGMGSMLGVQPNLGISQPQPRSQTSMQGQNNFLPPMQGNASMNQTAHAPPPPPPPGTQHHNSGGNTTNYSTTKTRQSVVTPSPAAGLSQQIVELNDSERSTQADSVPAPPPPGFESSGISTSESNLNGPFSGMHINDSSQPRNDQSGSYSHYNSNHPQSSSENVSATADPEMTVVTKPKRRVNPDAPYRAYLRGDSSETLWCYENKKTGETVPQESWFTASQMRRLLLAGTLSAAASTDSANDVRVAMALKKNDQRNDDTIMKTPFIAMKQAFPQEMDTYSKAPTSKDKLRNSRGLFEDAPEAFRPQISLGP